MKSLRPRLITTAVALAFAGVAQGQVVFDGRLGPAGPLTAIGGNFAITNAFGTQVGANLFHSFTTFNLASGTVATFSGNPGTVNIVSRVTGGSGSFIDGTLRSTIAGANLWFINPWGVTFGQNAQLDVSGAFHASTASYLVLGSGPGAGRFDAKSPAASVLTAAAPSAFGFLGTPAPLVVDKSFLQVQAGKELSLVGGAVDIKGIPGLEGVLLARGGRINLASAAGAGEIGLTPGGLTASAGMALGEVKLSKSFVITESPNASALDSGPVYIRGGKLVLADSLVTTGIGSGNTSTGNGGAINVALSGDLSMSNSEISAGVFAPGAPGDGGDVTISAGGAITMANNSLLRSVSVNGSGASGNLDLSAASLTVDNSLATTATGGAGTAGKIDVQVGDLKLLNNGRIRASAIYDGGGAPPSGTAGDITVEAAGEVSISGSGSGIFSSTTGYGDGGAIRVSAVNVNISDGGSIAAESRDPLSISGLFSPMGDSGSITVNASGSISLVNGSLSTFSETSGAGSITVNAVNTLSLDNSSITTATQAPTLVGGGAITIDPVFVILANGSRIDTSAFVGPGGPVSISTQFFMMSPDSLIDTSSTFGAAGTLSIDSPNQDSVPGLAALPSGYFDASALLRESCAAKAGRGANSFVGVGRGGLPAGPGSLAFANYTLPAAAASAATPANYPMLYAALPSGCVR